MLERAISLFIISGLFVFFVFLTYYFRHFVYQFLSILVLMVLQGVLFLYLNAEFVGAVQIIVYVGAILIMFLFTLFLFPEEELRGLSSDFLKVSYKTFIPLGLFILLVILSLYRSIPDVYQGQEFVSDIKIIGRLLFNEYWFLIYLLAFILSFPMVALYVFFRREDVSRDS